MRRRFGRPPPRWWPESEPWPPAGSPAPLRWQHLRGAFFWRIGVLVLLLFLLAFCISSFFVLTLVSLTGLLEPARLPLDLPRPAFALLFVLIVLVIFSAVRGVRRVALPLGDLVEATARVAEGDYSVRVEERGPREARTVARAFNSMADRLQSSASQRRALLADVTHELRTPLTVVQGNLEGMVDGIYPLDRAHLEPVLEETRLLARLIEDLRTLALAESGALELHLEPADLGTLVGETVASFRPQAESAGVVLQVETASEMPNVRLDPARIRQVIVNLVSNALRYTPRGGSIRVRCFLEDRYAVVTVADTGSGISPENLEHVFDRYYKASDSKGSGLGLAIARNLVVLHGGDISAESKAGAGTVIRFRLPL